MAYLKAYFNQIYSDLIPVKKKMVMLSHYKFFEIFSKIDDEELLKLIIKTQNWILFLKFSDKNRKNIRAFSFSVSSNSVITTTTNNKNFA